MKKYNLSFKFFDTLKEAELFKKSILKNANNYYKKNKKISITDWSSTNGKEQKKILWYYI